MIRLSEFFRKLQIPGQAPMPSLPVVQATTAVEVSDTTGGDSAPTAGYIKKSYKILHTPVGVNGHSVVVLKTTFGRSFIISKGI